MAKQMVYVEVLPETEIPIRILKTTKAAMDLPPERVRMLARSVAVGYIREQIVSRATKGYLTQCEFCGKVITPYIGHMHEVVSRGNGGEISVANSVLICPQCHLLDADSEHGNRKWGGKTGNTKEI